MKTRWSLFFAAALFGGWVLISHGAPLGPVLVGIGGLAAVNFLKQPGSEGVK